MVFENPCAIIGWHRRLIAIEFYEEEQDRFDPLSDTNNGPLDDTRDFTVHMDTGVGYGPPSDDFEAVWDQIWQQRNHLQPPQPVEPTEATRPCEPARNQACQPPLAPPLRVRERATAPPSSPKQAADRDGTPKKKRRALKIYGITFLTLAALYCVAVFSHIPFIEKWRTIYIETAMSTLNHHWLATAFIPQFVIDEAMSGGAHLDESQDGLSSNWSITEYSARDLYQPWKKLEKNFFKIYSEIEEESFQKYMEQNGNSCIDENGYLVIDEAGLNDGGTGIKTKAGDQVLAIDTYNGITIIKTTGEGYVARMAIVKDPSRVGVGLAPNFGTHGAVVGEIAESNNAILAINASGFSDPNGQGNGGQVYGLVISDGKIKNEAAGSSYKMIAFDRRNKLNIGQYSDLSLFRDAVEFKPALVINGKKTVSGSAGWGINPRSVIGQTKRGEVLLLIVDGRAPGYSIGNTVEECADIMLRYDAYQACNLDGGSSSVLYYNGREINKPSAANKKVGRSVPNGFVVYKR